MIDLSNTHTGFEEDEEDLLQTPVWYSRLWILERLDGDGGEGSRSNENENTIWAIELMTWDRNG